jgi:L-iditol 2-dehydrogenase
MKAIVSENHQSRVEEVPLPTLQSGDLLLQVNACGVCFSDVHKIRFQKLDRPSILGHEVAGKVVETGGDVTKFKNGDRVVVAHHVPCLRCHYCRHGNISMCPQFKKTNLDPGGFAEFVRVPALHVENVAFRVPAGLSDNEASFMEPLGCALRAVKRAGIQSGDLIVLVGLGSIGLLLHQLIRHLGAECIGIELDPERREFAKRFGLKDSFAGSETELNDSLAQKTDGRGADGVMFTAGSPPLVSTGLTWLRQGGTCTVFASLHPDSNVQLDWNQLYYRELNIVTSYSAAPTDLAEALDLLGKRNVRVNELTVDTFPLEQFTKALAAIESRAILKAIMIPHG